MLLASFTSGLLSHAGRQVRYAMPRTMDEALKIAITVNQAEMQERHNEAFYVDETREAGTANRHARHDTHRQREKYNSTGRSRSYTESEQKGAR
jgi:hypothetical protein